jgi:hypothetical protein
MLCASMLCASTLSGAAAVAQDGQSQLVAFHGG